MTSVPTIPDALPRPRCPGTLVTAQVVMGLIGVGGTFLALLPTLVDDETTTVPVSDVIGPAVFACWAFLAVVGVGAGREFGRIASVPMSGALLYLCASAAVEMGFERTTETDPVASGLLMLFQVGSIGVAALPALVLALFAARRSRAWFADMDAHRAARS